MTRKQIKKFVDQIVDLELVHGSPTASKEAKSRAERRMIQISEMIIKQPKGMEAMAQIDEIVQDRLNEIKLEKKVN